MMGIGARGRWWMFVQVSVGWVLAARRSLELFFSPSVRPFVCLSVDECLGKSSWKRSS
jgi:hypothetical protein